MKRNYSVITCCEITEVVAKSYHDTPDTMPINLINIKAKHKMDYYIFYAIWLVTICLFLSITIAINC